MSIEEDNSVESFQDCGFTLLQAQHLSRLSISMFTLIAKKREPCTKDMLDSYNKSIEKLKNDIDYYWEKYQSED
jgi:hypothetical protein